jgi:hypothetical protein
MNDRILTKFSDVLYYCLLLLIILFSFFNFSYRFYPLLNADMAINILMTPGYNLSHDLYAWGQDRGGSLIPLLSHLLYRITPISPVSAVSLVHYMILIIGYFAATTLFKSRYSKLFLALLWFFPPWHFTDFVLFPFGTQFSLFFVGLYFLRKSEISTSLLIQNLWLALSCLLMILSVWVSELGIIMVILLCFLKMYELIRSLKEKKNLSWNISHLMNVLIWIILGSAFILFAKSRATKIDVYTSHPFNDIGEVISSIHIILRSLFKVFTFSSENFIESIYAWMLILGVPIVKLLTIFTNEGWFRKVDRKWFLFFLVNGIITFFFIIFSHWVFLNGVGRRYFVLVYISFAIVILLLAETTEKRERRIVRILLAVMIVTGAISSVYKFYYPKHIPSRIKVLSELQSLGNIGIISEYWNSYISATPDPIHIKATPHDKDYVRNFELTEEVFNQPRIYLIKDGWMNSFPDTIRQFGRTLVRKGEKFYIAEGWLNQYEIGYPCESYFPSDLKYQGILIDDPVSKGGKAVLIGQGITFDKYRHFVYGPFVTLKPGNYIARFYLKVKENSSSELLAELDVSSDFGKKVIVSRKLIGSDFHEKEHYEAFDLSFEFTRQFEGVELRIFYSGKTDLYFDRVNLLFIKIR